MEIIKLENWARPALDETGRVGETVSGVLADIRERGDVAISEYSQKFDGYQPHEIPLKPFADYDLDPELREALQLAASRIERFADHQRNTYTEFVQEDEFGTYGQKIVPLERMAAYIPGGRFPLVSTALMTLIPARVAGVEERVAVSPSDHPAILAAASLAGATRFLHMGGAQAIAAMAYGSRWSEPVDMIVGPGNAYVNEAKAQLQGRVKIDTLAGPSEILVLCDDTANPHWVALDLLAQAEHDPMALSVVGSTSVARLREIAKEVEQIAARYPDKDTGIIQLVHCQNGEELEQLANLMAAEHLQVICNETLLDPMNLKHYGSLFIGNYSAVALGDYITGPNHTLPTVGVSRYKGGLQAGDFLKVITWQHIEQDGFAPLAKAAKRIAKEESLEFHYQSLAARE